MTEEEERRIPHLEERVAALEEKLSGMSAALASAHAHRAILQGQMDIRSQMMSEWAATLDRLVAAIEGMKANEQVFRMLKTSLDEPAANAQNHEHSDDFSDQSPLMYGGYEFKIISIASGIPGGLVMESDKIIQSSRQVETLSSNVRTALYVLWEVQKSFPEDPVSPQEAKRDALTCIRDLQSFLDTLETEIEQDEKDNHDDTRSNSHRD